MPGKETIEIDGAKTGTRSGLLPSTSNSTSAAMCQGNTFKEEVGAQDGRSKDEVKVLSRKGKDEAAVVMNAKVRCPESPVNQANESPVDQAKEEIEYWLEVKRLLVDPSDEARDQLEKLMEKREERESVTQLRSENKMVASAKDSLAYMALDIRGAVDDALLAVEDQQSLRLSRKCKTALDLAWKQYQTSHTLYVTKEKDEALKKDAFVQRLQHKKAFNAALEGLEEYIESLDTEPVEDAVAVETPQLLAKDKVRLVQEEGERKCKSLDSQIRKDLNSKQIVFLQDEIARPRENLSSKQIEFLQEELARATEDLISRLEKEYSSFGKLWKEEIGAKDWVQMCAKESLDPGEVAAEGKEEQLRVKVHHGLDEVLRGGQLDPGEGGSRRLKEVKVEKLNKVKDKDWGRIGAIKTLDPIEGVGLRWNWKEVEWLCFEVKQELNEASEALRLVTAWCSTLCAFSDYG